MTSEPSEARCVDLIAAIRALKFDDPSSVKELNERVNELHKGFEDQSARMAIRSEDLAAAYNL